MPIYEVYKNLSSSRIENVLALKGYSGYRLCHTGKGLFVEDQGNVLEDPGTTLYVTQRHLNFVCLCVFLLNLLLYCSQQVGDETGKKSKNNLLVLHI